MAETTAPAGYARIMGVPYARANDDGSVTCPRCSKRIALTARKDFESFSKREYADHYLSLHAVSDGLVKVDGVWYEPVTS